MSPTTVTGSPSPAFADALFARLQADSVLAALATSGIFGSLPDNARTQYPYVVVGRTELRPGGAGAMQREGGTVDVFVDVWSSFNGPNEAQAIQSRIRALLLRADVSPVGFALYAGSVECKEELCFWEFDTDMPERKLWHGVQQWTGLLEEPN
jgi:Protein of unknown function (DUF3168)